MKNKNNQGFLLIGLLLVMLLIALLAFGYRYRGKNNPGSIKQAQEIKQQTQERIDGLETQINSQLEDALRKNSQPTEE
jgi:type II secretory pathway pseudopilin PulG